MAVESALGSSLSELKHFFERRADVSFAFLFGSQAHGCAGPLSDVDIAVYFRPARRHPVEYESETCYPAEAEVWAGLEQVLGREVEMLVLNRASASVAASAIRGIPLVMKDLSQFMNFDEVVSRIAEDFGEMIVRDFLEYEGSCRKS